MGKMNWKHIILGGLMVGLIVFGLGFVNVLAFGQGWLDSLEQAGHPFEMTTAALTLIVLVFLGGGVLLMWLYAAIRPRYGPGPKTAAIAGFVFWMIACGVDAAWLSLDVFPVTRSLVVVGLLYLPIMVGTAILGAWIYKEVGGPEEGATEEG